MERETIVREFLDRHKIRYDIYHHPASPTIEEAKAHWREDGSKHCKTSSSATTRATVIIWSVSTATARWRFTIWNTDCGRANSPSPRRSAWNATWGSNRVPCRRSALSTTRNTTYISLDRHLQTCDSLSFHPNDCRATVVISRRIRTLPLPGRKYVRIPRPLRLTRLKSAAQCE